jgi:hypothetical protein
MRAPAGNLNVMLASVALAPEGVRGDGNCMIYAALRSSGRPASWNAAIEIREAAIALALALPREVKEDRMNTRMTPWETI